MSISLRPDLEIICEWIQPGAHILDLGCGDGTLLTHLRQTRNVTGYGLEIDIANVQQCIGSGIPVIQTNLDKGITEFFEEHSFDYVVMTHTLQAIHQPGDLLDEMLRIGQEGIVTFPNFAHWKSRVQLGLGGYMPVTRALPHEWHDTPNIHLCSIQDFEALCDKKGIRILQRAAVTHASRTGQKTRLWPNLFGESAIYRFCKSGA